MSISILAKIGEWVKENQADIAIVIGFILMGIIAFGAGRLSAPDIIRNPIVISEPNSTTSINFFSDVSQPVTDAVGEQIDSQASAKGLFVASKNSKVYHWPWCASAKKIKPENQLWFKTETQAKAAGYLPSSCIIPEAPAGYQAH
jgi:hypothetical protein